MNIRLKDTIVNLANIASIDIRTGSDEQRVVLITASGTAIHLIGPEAVWFFNTPGVLPILSLEEAYADREKIEAKAAEVIASRKQAPAQHVGETESPELSTVEAQLAQIDAALEAAKSENSLDPGVIARARERRNFLQTLVDKRKLQKVIQ